MKDLSLTSRPEMHLASLKSSCLSQVWVCVLRYVFTSAESHVVEMGKTVVAADLIPHSKAASECRPIGERSGMLFSSEISCAESSGDMRSIISGVFSDSEKGLPSSWHSALQLRL